MLSLTSCLLVLMNRFISLFQCLVRSSQECFFTASWKDAVMQVTLQLHTQDGSAFERKQIKLCLASDSGSQENENKRNILASSRFDLSNLRLQCNGDEG